jgi:hypothetical protein
MDHAMYRMGVAAPASADPRCSFGPRNSAEQMAMPAPITMPGQPSQATNVSPSTIAIPVRIDHRPVSRYPRCSPTPTPRYW